MFGRKKCDEKDKFNICAPAGTECEVMSTQDSCEGNNLVYCDDGFIEKTDCTALGFAGCSPLKVGTMTLGARCQ